MSVLKTSNPASRRGFLRGLTTLPLIGGSVALIGNPTAAAELPSERCLESYLAWLHFEYRFAHGALYPGSEGRGWLTMTDNPGGTFHFRSETRPGSDWASVHREAAARAPVVLAAVGCDWQEGRR